MLNTHSKSPLFPDNTACDNAGFSERTFHDNCNANHLKGVFGVICDKEALRQKQYSGLASAMPSSNCSWLCQLQPMKTFASRLRSRLRLLEDFSLYTLVLGGENCFRALRRSSAALCRAFAPPLPRSSLLLPSLPSAEEALRFRP